MVIFTKAKNCVLVEVPDLEILTEGKDMSDAIEMARDAIELNCVSREDAKEEIPEPSDMNVLDESSPVERYPDYLDDFHILKYDQ